MRNLIVLTILSAIVLLGACKKDKHSERFIFLTAPTWLADTLLANGVDGSQTGGILEKFKGEAKFNEDGTGNFGTYKGEWYFNPDETEITIITDSLPLPIISKIKELTASSLKITTTVPNLLILTQPISIRMTFKAK